MDNVVFDPIFLLNLSNFKLRQEEYRLFLFLCHEMNVANLISGASQTDLAKCIHLAQQSFSEGLETLRKLNLVKTQSVATNKSLVYMLNPQFVSKSELNHVELLKIYQDF